MPEKPALMLFRFEVGWRRIVCMHLLRFIFLEIEIWRRQKFSKYAFLPNRLSRLKFQLLYIKRCSLSSSISNFGVAILALETTALTRGNVTTLFANSLTDAERASRFPILHPLHVDWWWLRCLPEQISLWVKSGQQ